MLIEPEEELKLNLQILPLRKYSVGMLIEPEKELKLVCWSERN